MLAVLVPLQVGGPPLAGIGHEVKGLPGVDSIRGLASFRKVELAVQPGMHQAKTIDCFTRPGAVQLVNEDPTALAADVAAIRDLELNGLFQFS